MQEKYGVFTVQSSRSDGHAFVEPQMSEKMLMHLSKWITLAWFNCVLLQSYI